MGDGESNDDEDTHFIDRGHLDELGIIDISNWHESTPRHAVDPPIKKPDNKVPPHLEELLKKMRDK